jgi:hypothetical protein
VGSPTPCSRVRALRGSDGGFEVTGQGERLLGRIGVDVGAAGERRRAFALACLDWTERRSQLAGALGADVSDRLFELGWVERRGSGRAMGLTVAGSAGLRELLGPDLEGSTGVGHGRSDQLVTHPKMLRLELLKVKADLERELEHFSLNCSKCGSTCIGSPASASSRGTGAHREPSPHGEPAVSSGHVRPGPGSTRRSA